MVTNPKFKFIGGSLCLDFVNTVGGRVASGGNRDYADRIVGEKFVRFDDLMTWGKMAGVLGPSEALVAPRRAAALLARAIAFREALYRITKCLVEGWAPPEGDLGMVNREIVTAESHRRLTFSGDRLSRTWDDAAAPDRILWAAAESAAVLLASPDASSLRQCPGEECGWIFLDTSRNHARRWCQMRICGNRAKVRRFRQGG